MLVHAAIMSPIAGLAVDRIGRNVYWILGATFFTGVAHAIMAYTYTIPIVATFIMGISYSSASPAALRLRVCILRKPKLKQL